MKEIYRCGYLEESQPSEKEDEINSKRAEIGAKRLKKGLPIKERDKISKICQRKKKSA